MASCSSRTSTTERSVRIAESRAHEAAGDQATLGRPRRAGLGVGRRLLEALEERAEATGTRSVRLDTNAALTEAIALYRATGYVEVSRFNNETYADFWFEKRLTKRQVGYRG